MCSVSFWTYAWRQSMVSICNADAVCILWGTNWYFTYYLHELRATSSVSSLIHSVAGHLPRRTGFDPGWVQVKFEADDVALCQIFPSSTSVFPVNIYPKLFVRIFISVNSLSEGQAGEVWASSNKEVFCVISGSTGHKTCCPCSSAPSLGIVV
jgi:hypothetical protein